jgi:glycosyltransferase involved in cell wall biosynthesis
MTSLAHDRPPAETSGAPVRTVAVLAYSDSAIFSGAEALFCKVLGALSPQPSLEIRCAAPARNRALSGALAEAVGSEPIDVPVQPLSVAAAHLYDPRRRAAVRRVLEAERCDVVFVNLPSAEYGGTPLLAGQGSSATTLGLLHVPGSPAELGFRFGWARERLARGAMRNLDSVCLLTDAARSAFERHWRSGRTELHTVPMPTPSVTRLARDEARAALGLPDSTLVGMAGRISFKQKGQDTFLAAAELLLRERPDLRFAIAGDGRDRGRLERLIAARGLGERVILLGHLTPIDPFLSALDAIAIPSRFEGLPLVALEALALGLPGVAASSDGLRDLWPTAWQVPASDPAAFARALAELLDATSAQRSRLVAQGRRLMERFTTDDLGAAFEPTIVRTAHV